MELQHFSHEHPLILKKVQEKTDVEMICYGCGKAITESDLAYGCGECGSFFLHKACAEMPSEMNHPMHSQHPLLLLAKATYSSGSCICNVCLDAHWKRFTYHCSECHFDACLVCALVSEQRFEHPSHLHPLMLQRNLASFICHACRTEDKDQSYLCTTCPFWIHEKCFSLPSVIKYKDHDHLLSLIYSLPMEYHSYRFPCDVCGRKLHRSHWVYYCGPCRFFVHLKCTAYSRLEAAGTSRQPDASNLDEGELNFEEIESLFCDPVHLPTDNFDQIIRKFTKQYGRKNIKGLQIYCSGEKGSGAQEQQHSPILVNVQPEDSEIDKEEIVCDCCIKPIVSATFYKCGKCEYNFHLACGKLPLRIDHNLHREHPLILWPLGKKAKFFNHCNGCGYPTNGMSYWCESCDFRLDVKCASLPTVVTHEAHKHPLSLLETKESNVKVRCNACSRPYFGCEPCGFYLDYACAQLPQTVEHRSEKHPLILSFPPFNEHPDEFYCVVCEHEIHPKFWLYFCCECDQSFHPTCIFKSAFDRNFKFGRAFEVGNSHPHPLVIVREANFHLSCNSCHVSLHERITFACKSCLFYLCVPCARRSSPIVRYVFSLHRQIFPIHLRIA